MRTTTLAVVVVLSIACLSEPVLCDPQAVTSTPAAASPLTLDTEKQAAFDAINQCRQAKTTAEFAQVLTNKCAAQMAVAEATGIGLLAAFQSMGSKATDPNLNKDLLTYLGTFGLTEKTMPTGSLEGLPAETVSRGREMLSGMLPFEQRAQKISTDSKITPPASDWPPDISGYKMSIVDANTVKVKIIAPKPGTLLPTAFTVRLEDSQWRIDLGDLTKLAQGTNSTGGSPNYPETPGVPASKLFDAVMNDDPHTVKVILAAHPNLLEARDNQGATPLISVAFWDHLEIARILVSLHADINAKDNGGNTPLMNASSFDHIEIAKFLIAHGADLTRKDDFGKTALDQAYQMNHPEIMNLLKSHGAK